MQAEQAQRSYKKAGCGGGRAAVQQELCRRTHTRGTRDSRPPYTGIQSHSAAERSVQRAANGRIEAKTIVKYKELMADV